MSPARSHSGWTRTARWSVAAALLVVLGLALLRQVREHRNRALTDPARQGRWTAYGSTWNRHDRLIENSADDRGAKYILDSDQRSDYQIEADLRIAEEDGEAGLILRSSGEEVGVDAYHGYFAGVRLADATVEFGRTDFGWHPLRRASLPADADLKRGFHLRVVAVGCDFGVEVRLLNGRTTALTTTDDACIRSGHSGLRSALTSATWQNLVLRPASTADLQALATEATAPPLSLTDTYAAGNAARYAASLRAEAKERSLHAGAERIIDYLMRPGRHPNVTLQGAIISLPPLVAIQDDTNALIVPNAHFSTPVKLGDIVIAQGTLVSTRFRSSLEDADIRVLWSDIPLPPLAVTAAQLTGGTYRGRTIELEGTLISAGNGPHGQQLVLHDGALAFRGIGIPSYHIDVDHMEPGSRLRLRGFATSLTDFTDGTFPFAVLVDQVDVVSSPPWWSPRHIVMLGLGSVLLVLAIQFGIHRAQQWHLESVMKEREQLAFEMHDTLAQSFTGIAYQLNAARLERRGQEKVQTHIDHALTMVHQSHKEASRTIAALRPQLRDPAAILDTLEQSARRLANGGTPEIRTRLLGRAASLPVGVTDGLFRIAQEAISNAIQHSGCTLLEIELKTQKREAELSIRDNGHGFRPGPADLGLGLAGMRSRAQKIRARLEVVSNPDEGTTIRVVAPIPLTSGLLRRLSDRLHAVPAQHPLKLTELVPRREPYDLSR